jgi:hypothetical protein
MELKESAATSFLPAMTSNPSRNKMEGAEENAWSNSSRILCSDSPDVPPISSGPEAYSFQLEPHVSE